MTDRSDPPPDTLLGLLADHDAGLPVDPAVLADPRARSVLDALAATRAELAAAPPVPVPPGLAARWTAALTDSASTPPEGSGEEQPRIDRSGAPGPAHPEARLDPVTRADPTAPAAGPCDADESGVAEGGAVRRSADRSGATGSGAGWGSADRGGAAESRPGEGDTFDHPAHGPSRPAPPRPRPPAVRPGPRGPVPPGRPRSGPGRSRRPRPAVVAGLVLAIGLVVAGVIGVRPAPASVTAAQLGGIARAAVGVQEAGPLADPARRAACLRAVAPPGLAPDAPLAGGRSVVFEGRPGVLLLLITGRLATFRVVVVTPGCDALLADTVIGP